MWCPMATPGTGATFGTASALRPAHECIGGAETTTAIFPRSRSVSPLVSQAMSPSPHQSQRSVVNVRLAVATDAEAMRTIYNHEVENHTTTLDMVPRTLAAQQDWISMRSGAFSAVVAEHDGEVVGFASLSPYKERAAYSTTVENSVYVSREHAGHGIGRTMMDHVIDVARTSGFHSMMARIEASGAPSRALHSACGFELVGIERQVGRKHRKWLDVAVMQLML